MSNRILVVTAAALTVLACAAAAQQMHEPAGASPTPAANALPEECRAAGGRAQATHGGEMQGAPQASDGMMAHMTEAQQGYLQSMVKMRAPMRTGIMASDPDVGFMCGMIPHHQGAIDMAEVVLRTGHDPEVRRFAERVIRDQGQQIAEMKDWLSNHAGKERRSQ